jgi:hypothetical protein
MSLLKYLGKEKKNDVDKIKKKSTITITFGDQAENHKGMQIIGKKAERGFNKSEMEECKLRFEKEGYECELINLFNLLPTEYHENTKEAYLLIIRNGATCMLKEVGGDADKLMEEQLKLNYDSKAFMYGRVVNKHARHNLCFGDEEQEPSYEEGKGRIVAYSSVPLLNHLKEKMGSYITGGEDLYGEGNYYYDVTKCGIGFHSDLERYKVFAVRMGVSLPIHFHWFLNSKPIGERGIYMLNHGDVYIMSEKTTGQDGRKKTIPILRHATGCDKFTKIE